MGVENWDTFVDIGRDFCVYLHYWDRCLMGNLMRYGLRVCMHIFWILDFGVALDSHSLIGWVYGGSRYCWARDG